MSKVIKQDSENKPGRLESSAVLKTRKLTDEKKTAMKNMTPEQKQQLNDFIFGKTTENPLASK